MDSATFMTCNPTLDRYDSVEERLFPREIARILNEVDEGDHSDEDVHSTFRVCLLGYTGISCSGSG